MSQFEEVAQEKAVYREMIIHETRYSAGGYSLVESCLSLLFRTLVAVIASGVITILILVISVAILLAFNIHERNIFGPLETLYRDLGIFGGLLGVIHLVGVFILAGLSYAWYEPLQRIVYRLRRTLLLRKNEAGKYSLSLGLLLNAIKRHDELLSITAKDKGSEEEKEGNLSLMHAAHEEKTWRLYALYGFPYDFLIGLTLALINLIAAIVHLFMLDPWVFPFTWLDFVVSLAWAGFSIWYIIRFCLSIKVRLELIAPYKPTIHER